MKRATYSGWVGRENGPEVFLVAGEERPDEDELAIERPDLFECVEAPLAKVDDQGAGEDQVDDQGAGEDQVDDQGAGEDQVDDQGAGEDQVEAPAPRRPRGRPRMAR